jgi:hypothetical protein
MRFKATHFSHLREQRTWEHVADAGAGTQQLVALAPQGIIANQIAEFIVEAEPNLLPLRELLSSAQFLNSDEIEWCVQRKGASRKSSLSHSSRWMAGCGVMKSWIWRGSPMLLMAFWQQANLFPL